MRKETCTVDIIVVLSLKSSTCFLSQVKHIVIIDINAQAFLSIVDAMARRRKDPAICCIPISDSDDSLWRSNDEIYYTDCSGHDVIDYDSKLVIQSGPHRFHAIASRDITAGTVIIQCLPFAHSLLALPGMQIQINEFINNDMELPKRCTRCFVTEDNNRKSETTTRRLFGRCSKCRVVSYCSRYCQAEDWREQHKIECQYYVKRRKYSIGPPQCAEDEAIPILLRAYQKLKYMRDNTYSKTEKLEEGRANNDLLFDGEPIISCGPHHFSCMSVAQELFASNAYCDEPLNSPALLLAKELMESFAVRGNLKKGSMAALDIWGYGVKSQKDFCKTMDQAIRRAINAFAKNNFGIVNALHSSIGEGVYPCAALLNHSCNPNCILRYKLGTAQSDNQYYPPILQIVACTDICAGDELCHSYVDIALSTEVRRMRLKETHNFVCECKRCVAGGCLVRLPMNQHDLALWPFMCGLRDHGGYVDDDISPSLIELELDYAITWCRGLSDDEQLHIHQLSEELQQKANQSMIDDNPVSEMRYLKEAVSLYDTEKWSPFHVKLYALRSSYLHSLLGCGCEYIQDIIEQCEHIVSFLKLVTSHIENHPLLGLQLFTLGDLYVRAIVQFENSSESLCIYYKHRALAAFRWAKKVMIVSHGEHDAFVMNLTDNIATITASLHNR